MDSQLALAYKDRTAQQADYPVEGFHIHSHCEECKVLVLQEEHAAFQRAKKQARCIKGDPHLFNWDVIAALPNIQIDVLMHLLEPYSSFLCGSPVGSDRRMNWARLSHRQRINAVKREIGRVRPKCFHKKWQGQMSCDRLFFEVRKSGGRVSIHYATAFLGFKTKNGHGIRKLVSRDARLKIVDGFVVLTSTPITIPTNHHVTMQRRHGYLIPNVTPVMDDYRLSTRRGTSHTTDLKPRKDMRTGDSTTLPRFAALDGYISPEELRRGPLPAARRRWLAMKEGRSWG